VAISFIGLSPKYLTRALRMFRASATLSSFRVEIPEIFNPEVSSIGVSPGRRSEKMIFMIVDNLPEVLEEILDGQSLQQAQCLLVQSLSFKPHGSLEHARDSSGFPDGLADDFSVNLNTWQWHGESFLIVGEPRFSEPTTKRFYLSIGPCKENATGHIGR
jgi:hypothetical protein